jgi:hypothetical protein
MMPEIEKGTKLDHPMLLIGKYFELNCDVCGYGIGWIAEGERCAVLCNLCIAQKVGLKHDS